MKLRHILRLYGLYMWRAGTNCDMNHAMDYGEWSSAYDEETYDFFINLFKQHLQRIGENITDICERLKQAMYAEQRPWICSELHSIINTLQ